MHIAPRGETCRRKRSDGELTISLDELSELLDQGMADQAMEYLNYRCLEQAVECLDKPIDPDGVVSLDQHDELVFTSVEDLMEFAGVSLDELIEFAQEECDSWVNWN